MALTQQAESADGSVRAPSRRRRRRASSAAGAASRSSTTCARRSPSAEFADGDRLIEERIAEELQTSRGPVREALRQLEHEGLVISYPYRGAVVQGVSEEEIQEVLIPIRLTLERFSFTKALEQMDDGDFAELAKEVWTMARGGARAASCCAWSRPTSASTSSCSRGRASRTRRRSGARSRRASAPTSSATASPPISTQIAIEHGELLQAVQTGDRDKVLAAVERHITVRTPGP